jgi:Mlc titration factor MtfA (ptsG expression regulator)
MNHAYVELQQRLAAGADGLIEPYAVTDPAEFFAVTSELFFERPAELAALHPAVYAELAQLYQAHPLQWAEATATLRPAWVQRRPAA